MTPEEAERYHAIQIGTFAATTADQVTAITMTNAEEAIGIVHAASAAGIPAAISFTVETDGRLPTGQPLREAIEQVDAATGARAAYFMVNCAHPDSLRRFAGSNTMGRGGAGSSVCARTHRRGATPNSTTRPNSTRAIQSTSARGTPRCVTDYPTVTVLGGCCGTDARHVAAIVSAWRPN